MHNIVYIHYLISKTIIVINNKDIKENQNVYNIMFTNTYTVK